MNFETLRFCAVAVKPHEWRLRCTMTLPAVGSLYD